MWIGHSEREKIASQRPDTHRAAVLNLEIISLLAGSGETLRVNKRRRLRDAKTRKNKDLRQNCGSPLD